MNPEVKPGDLTGDHAGVPIKVLRLPKLELPSIFKETLEKKMKEYNGVDSEEGQIWYRDICQCSEFFGLTFSEMCNYLLIDEAKILWGNATEEGKKPMSDVESKNWFQKTFIKKVPLLEELDKLSQICQGENERFLTFELRVRKTIENFRKHSDEEILNELLKKRIKSQVLKDRFVFKPNISVDEMRAEAKIYEDNISKEERNDVLAVKTSYAEMAKKDKHQVRRYENPEHKRNTARLNETNDRQPILRTERRIPSERFNKSNEKGSSRMSEDKQQYNRPVHSAWYEARKLYCKIKRLPTPEEEHLTRGDCYCCGKHGHLRKDCPLNNRCLICGKSGHGFRNCNHIKNVNVVCIKDVYNEDNVDIVSYKDEYEDDLNARDSMVSISSVESA